MDNQEPSQLSKTNSKFFYGYFVVAAAFFIMVIMLGTFNAFGVFFKPLLTEFGWTRAETSGAFSVSWIIQGLFGIVAGRVNDRFGPRIVITVCGCIMGLAYLLMSQISTLWQLYLFYAILVAIGMSGNFIPLMATVARWFVKRRNIMTGIVLSGAGIGGLIGPPVANWLISIYDWRVSYIILGSISLVAVVLFAQLLRFDPTQVGQMPYGENKGETGLKGDTKTFSLKEAASTRQFWLISSMFFSIGFSMYTILVHIAPHATDLEFSATSAANILAATSGASVIGRVVLGLAADRIGNRLVYIIGFVLMAAALFWLVPATGAWGLYLFATIFGFAYGGMITSESPMVAEFFGLRSLGSILAVTTLGF